MNDPQLTDDEARAMIEQQSVEHGQTLDRLHRIVDELRRVESAAEHRQTHKETPKRG